MSQLLPDVTKYVRRPEASQIEAVQFDGTGTHAAQILRWCNAATISATADITGTPDTGDGGWRISVKGDADETMYAVKGDWVAKGALGQTYTLPDDIFQATYDVPMEASSAPHVDV